MLSDERLVEIERHHKAGDYWHLAVVEELLVALREMQKEQKALATHLEDTVDPECRQSLDETLTTLGVVRVDYVEATRRQSLANEACQDLNSQINALRNERDTLQRRVEALSQLLADAQPPAGMPNEGDIQYWYEQKDAALHGGGTG